MSIVNHRQPGESFLAYRDRRRFVNRIIKSALKGRYAIWSRDKSHFSGIDRAQPPRRYVPGPHKSHQPHEVTAFSETPWVDAYGKVHENRMFRVTHPGTLAKEVKW